MLMKIEKHTSNLEEFAENNDDDARESGTRRRRKIRESKGQSKKDENV